MWFGEALDQQAKADAKGWLTAKAFGAELTIPVGAAIDWLNAKNARLMREVLHEAFVAPGVMWSPLEQETPEQVLESLGMLEPALRTRAEEFRKQMQGLARPRPPTSSFGRPACLCAEAVRDGTKRRGDSSEQHRQIDPREPAPARNFRAARVQLPIQNCACRARARNTGTEICPCPVWLTVPLRPRTMPAGQSL